MTDCSGSSPYSKPDPDTDRGAYLRDLVKDLPRLRSVIEKDQHHADSLIATLHTLVTPRVGIGLLHGLALSEIARATKLSVKSTPSNLCGQARFLRGLIVSHELDPDGTTESGPTMTAAWHTMMETVEDLWKTLFYLERLEGELVKHSGRQDERQVEDAGVAATYGRMDIDIGYVEPVEDRCREVFTPLEKEFVIPRFGVGLDRLLTGFSAIKEKAKLRLNDAMKMTRRTIDPRASQWLLEAVIQQRFETSLEVTSHDLPASWTELERRAFLEAFSLTAGENEQVSTRPAHENVTMRKPLLRLSGARYYLMDPIFCRYAPNRLLCHAVETSSFRDRFFRLRDGALERRVGQLFAEATEPIAHYSSIYLPVGDKGDLAEQDHIVIADRCAFFIECKAKRVRNPLSHSGNVAKVRDDLRSSVQAGFEQGDRARRHLMAQSGSVPVFDKHGKTIGTIDRDGIDSAHVIVVSWENLCPLSIDLQPWLKVPEGTEYPWTICVDTLQTALTRLHRPAEIAKYIAWRSSLNGALVAGDELDVVGCFLANHTKLPSDYDRIMIDDSYGSIFDDDFFAAQGIDREVKPPDPKPTIIRLAHEDGRPTARLDGKLIAGDPRPRPPARKAVRRFKKRKPRR